MIRIRFAIFVFLGFIYGVSGFADDEVKVSNKFSFRLGMGTLQNAAAGGGSTSVSGAPDLIFNFFLSPKVSVYVSYLMVTDSSSGTLPLQGFDLGARYYFSGNGTHVTYRANESVTIQKQEKYAFYLTGAFFQRSYFLGSNTSEVTTVPLTGNFNGISGGIGGDLRLNDHWELNAEINKNLKSFSTTDDRVRLSAMLTFLGLSYVW